MTRWWYGVILPLAGGLTFGLGCLMASVVSAEFVPQPTDRDRTRVATYIFDPALICGSYSDRRGSVARKLALRSPPYSKIISDPFVQNPHDE